MVRISVATSSCHRLEWDSDRDHPQAEPRAATRCRSCGRRGQSAGEGAALLARPLGTGGTACRCRRRTATRGPAPDQASSTGAPGRAFRPPWYRDRYPAAAAAGGDLLRHFLERGAARGHLPSPLWRGLDADGCAALAERHGKAGRSLWRHMLAQRGPGGDAFTARGIDAAN